MTRLLPVFGSAGGKAGTVFRVFFTFAIMHVGRVLFREPDLSMIWQDLTLNPFAASGTEWHVGAGVCVESVLYGLPLTLVFPLLEYCDLLPPADDLKMGTWRWTLAQALLATTIVLGILAMKSPETGDFIYFQF